MSFEKQHLRYCLLFTFQLKKSAAEAQEMICSALGETAVSYSTCKKRFKTGNFDFNEEKCPGQLKKINDEELQQFLEENFCRTQSELAQEFVVTRQAISKRLHKLRRIQKEDHWISHELTAENKRKRYDVAVLLLSRKRKIFCTRL